MSATGEGDVWTPDSPENPHAGRGTVVLDIGGEIGALIVTMPVEMVGSEVDIAPAGHEQDHLAHGHDDGHEGDHDDVVGHGHGHGHGHRPHVAVVRRPVPGGDLVPSLVYPDLVEGRYSLLVKGTDDVVLQVDVIGGEVAEATWPV